MRLLIGVLVVTTACGRVAFDRTPDAAPGDGTDAPMMTTDAPPSLCAGLGATLVCDGFEGTSIDPRWQLDVEQGQVTLSTVRAYRGGSSLHSHTDQITTMTDAPRASLISYQGLPVTGVVYARVFVYFPAPVVLNFVQFLNFADAGGQGVSYGSRNLKVVDNDYSSTTFRESATAFPFDRWACLQMSIPSDTTGTIRLYVDGIEITDAAIATGPIAHPRPSHVYLGIDWPNTYTQLSPSEAWFDELLISDAPISCAD